jgi:hypothetical protein
VKFKILAATINFQIKSRCITRLLVAALRSIVLIWSRICEAQNLGGYDLARLISRSNGAQKRLNASRLKYEFPSIDKSIGRTERSRSQSIARSKRH